jgi:hypothetical protein
MAEHEPYADEQYAAARQAYPNPAHERPDWQRSTPVPVAQPATYGAATAHRPAGRAPRRTRTIAGRVVIGIVVAAFAVCVGGSFVAVALGGFPDTDTDTAPTASTGSAADTAPAASVKATPAKPPRGGITEEGTLLVPAEVKPGTYRATVPGDSTGCYWARLRSADESDIIDNGLGQAGQKMTITIKSSDRALDTRGCGDWTKIG